MDTSATQHELGSTITLRLIAGILAFLVVAPLVSAEDAVPAPQKAVLVTGASTGIGRKITGRLAAEGCFVYAGVAIAGPIVQTTDEDFDCLMDVNVYGPYRVTRAFSPLLIEAFGDALAAEMAQSQAGR